MKYTIEVKENEVKENDATAVIHVVECKEVKAEDVTFTTLNVALAAAEFVAAHIEKHSCVSER